MMRPIYRIRTGKKSGSSWTKMAARRSARGKTGLYYKHVEPGRRGWLDQQRRGEKGYS